MLKTVEVRWFFPGEIPPAVTTWFISAAPSSISEPIRTDYYLNLLNQEAMGIKVREGWLEVKQRPSSIGRFQFQEKVIGQLESWRKWGINLGALSGVPANEIEKMWIPVVKERQIYSYKLSGGIWQGRGGKLGIEDQGCEIELSKINAFNRTWWSFAFEASGTSNQNKRLLIEASKRFLALSDPPSMPLTHSYGYPTWIGHISCKGKAIG
ncbi:MAG: hypothetical protein BMS9Abin02_2169 [Anaerolineae bacterium]|nr:MAG: hypothetical protein BMS9Abin02_2169 [Anaerolineae bacterium]